MNEMSRALDVVTLTGAEYDALTQRADDWYALYARAAKERTAALEDVERWKKAAESNIEENVGLRLAEEDDMSKDEQAIEAEIQAKGLNAPRLSPEKIDAVISGEDYHVFPGTTLTVCCLKLRNGFTVTGESAAASPENFDVELGRKIARSNARDKIWALEGYALRERLAD
jgi:hypothetical protein